MIDTDIATFIAVGFRLFVGYSLLLFMLSFMWSLFRNLWDTLFDSLKNLPFKFK